jgi:hypothetical protein
MAVSTWFRGVGAFAAAAVVGACAKSDQKTGDSGAVQQGGVVAPAVVSFQAKDNVFTGPDTLSAGETTFQLTNDGPSLHHLQLVRLDSGKTLADLEGAMKHPGPMPAWAVMVGGPNAPDPGAQSNATVDLIPGNYLVTCFVDQPGGIPHIMKGMVKPLTVVASTGPAAAAPAADVNVDMKDYGYTFSTPLTAGHHVIAVTNSGTQPHEFELVKLDSGKTAQELIGWIAKPGGPPPGHALGGVDGLAPGQPAVTFSADLTQGNYAVICFLPDAKDGQPHFTHGMIHTLTIM